MRKLMTMLAAVGMAFGLYAADPIPPIQTDGFEGTWEQTNWTVSDATFATQAVYTADEKYTKEQPQSFDGVGSNYLELKTDLKIDKAVIWANSAVDKAIGDGIYFDGLVRFEDCDETNALPFEVDGANKLAVYTYLDSDNEAEGSHLFVAAGHFDGANWSTKYYDCGKLALYARDESGFDRVTIRAIADISSGAEINPGFVVFVNGKNAAYVDSDKDGIGTIALTSTAGAWNSKRSLFPSLVQKQTDTALSTLTAVAFTGHGSIDNVVITREQPTFAQDNFFTLTKDEHINSFKYAVNDGDAVEADDTVAIALDGKAMTVVISDIDYVTADGQYEQWGEGEWEAYQCSVDVATKTFTILANAEKPTGKLVSKDVAPRITIGANTYATFAEAIAALPTSGDVTMTLNQGIKVGKNALGGTEATFESGANVTIDLNGQTITGEATGFVGYVINATGNLTIKDSSDAKTGAISMAGGTSYAGVVMIQSPDQATAGNLTIEAGAFNGKVNVDPGDTDYAAATGVISGGSLLKSANAEPGTEGGLTLADGFKLGPSAGDYWDVVAKAKYTISVTGAANAVVTINDTETNELELTEGAAYDIVVTPKANYEYKDDGTYDPFEFDEGTLKKSGTATATAAFAAADAIAKVYTITYLDGNEDPYTGLADSYTKFTVETGSITPYTPTEIFEGHEFSGWTLNDQPWTGDLTGITDDITVYSTWDTAHQYNITYVFVDEKDEVLTGVTNPYAATTTFTVEDADIEFTEEAELENYEFDSWTPDTIVCSDTFSDVVVTGKFVTAVVPTPVPVDDPDKLTEKGLANAQAVADTFGAGLDTYLSDMGYTDGKIPAEKLNDTTDELIAAAKEYNLKIMANPVEVAVETAEDGGFTFTLTDAADANPVVLKTKAQELIKYSASLEDGGEFAPSTEETVTAEVSDDFKVSAKFTGKDAEGEAANAGFMKVDLTVAE